MINTYNVDYFYREDILYQLSKLSGKAVMYIRADGPNNCEDANKINDIWEFYYDKCDNVVVSGLIQDGELYCNFLTIEQAFQAFHDWFPQKEQLEDDEMDFYIFARLVSVSDDVDMING